MKSNITSIHYLTLNFSCNSNCNLKIYCNKQNFFFSKHSWSLWINCLNLCSLNYSWKIEIIRLEKPLIWFWSSESKNKLWFGILLNCYKIIQFAKNIHSFKSHFLMLRFCTSGYPFQSTIKISEFHACFLDVKVCCHL